MLIYERAVHFEEVDAAQILFFARFLGYCHEAMEALFAPLEGGYAHLVTKRKIGLPAVHVEIDFRSPLRYGESVRIGVEVTKIGTKSCTLHYVGNRLSDGGCIAEVTHTCVLSDLVALRGIPIPADVRAILEAHLVVAQEIVGRT